MWIPEEKWRYVSAAEMRAADRHCIEEIGIPGAVLMENAGAAVFAEVRGGPVGVVCGKGNNGGDGYVVARHALLAGHAVRVVVLANAGELKDDAKLYHDVYTRLGGSVVYAPGEAEAGAAVAALGDCAILVDAILGTGFAGEVRGAARAAIEAWPRVWTVAVDLPSGMNADTGAPGGACIRADVTVTFQAAKLGFRAAAARPWLGRVRAADIGIPARCFAG